MDISIIIPIYNVEEYVEECVESILKQRRKQKFEIILINDGSTDNSLSRIKKYEKMDNIKIITKKNGGLSSARNRGIEVAQGEYIIFIDSDDFIEEDFIEKLYNFIKKNSLDVVFSSYKNYYNCNKVKIQECIYNEDKILEGNEAIQNLLSKKTFRAEVWDDVYSSKFLKENSIKFTEGVINEDEEFTAKVLVNAKKVGYLNYNGYIYRQREGSITKKVNYKNIVNSRVIIIENLIREYEKLTDKACREFILWRIESLVKGLLINMKKGNVFIEYNHIIKFLIENNKGGSKIKYRYIEKRPNGYIKYIEMRGNIKRGIKGILR